MRVLVAPGHVGTRLDAAAVGRAIRAGWRRRAPDDQVATTPVCDAGIGYVDVLHAALGGELHLVTVPDTGGHDVPATILVTGDTAYVEAAQVDHRGAEAAFDPEHATSLGVGRLVDAAVATGARRVVVGAGPGGGAGQSNDGGAGLLAGLGVRAEPVDALVGGAAGLACLESVDLDPALRRLFDVELVVATDCEAPLAGLSGTTNVDGAARGLESARIPVVDASLERLASVVGGRHALTRGAGAGGGIGHALLTLGGTRTTGTDSVLAAVGLAEQASRAGLVVAAVESFDPARGEGGLAIAVAAVAAGGVRPCILLAERVRVGSREARASGLESAYGAEDLVPLDQGEGDVGERLAALAERVARTWSWSA